VGDWPEVPLGELVEVAVGGLWGSETPTLKEDTPVRVIRGIDAHKMSQREAVELPIRWVSAKQLASRILHVGDVVLEASGACGRSYVIQGSDIEGEPIPVSFSNFSRRLIPNARVEPAYLGYRLRQAYESGEISSYVTGTAMPNLDVHSTLAGISVLLPPLPEQRKIASILGALDDKIELNRRMNTTLEAMARAIFQSWFVDFDPVHAKADGRQPVGMDAETAALFPDSFEDSALGPIPKGWQIKPIDEIADFLNGLALQKYPVAGERSLPVIKIAQLKNGHDTLRADRCARRIPEEFVIQNGDVLFSWSGSLEVEIWSGGEGALNQHLFKVTSERYPKWFYYLWIITHLEDFRSIASGKATTMGHIQRKHLTAAKALVPSHELMVRMHEILNPIIEQANSFELQVKELRQLRDALLPKLLSGELRVGDVAA
jgi:type I restriction enzyme S subunit